MLTLYQIDSFQIFCSIPYSAFSFQQFFLLMCRNFQCDVVSFYFCFVLIHLVHLSRYLLIICMLLKNVYSGNLPIFNQFTILILSCVSYLNIMDINPFSNNWFARIFSFSTHCFLILSIVHLLCRSCFI